MLKYFIVFEGSFESKIVDFEFIYCRIIRTCLLFWTVSNFDFFPGCGIYVPGKIILKQKNYFCRDFGFIFNTAATADASFLGRFYKKNGTGELLEWPIF